VRELQERWTAEAGRNQVFPMVDELISRINAMVPPPNPPGPRNVYRPEGGPVPDDSVPRMFGGVRITASVTVPERDPAGVLCAMGDWTGGFALYVLDGRLVFALNRAGDPAAVTSDSPVPAGEHTLGCVYSPGRGSPEITLLCDDDAIGRAALPFAFPVVWQHGGTSLQLGEDRGLPVSADYEVPFGWNGELTEVVVETGPPAPRPTPGEVRAAVHSE
jgi:arylsulfatase